jgi:peptidoglycan/LPS O-acetylase OafA/YrhL
MAELTSELSTHAKPALVKPLTGIRGLAALAVVLYHLPSMGLNGPALYGPFATLVDTGWMGVDLFFILSGFVLSMVHQRDFAERLHWTDIKRFWQLRFARVYPLHFVLLLIYGAIIGLQTMLVKPIDYPGLTWLEFIGALFLAQIWMPIHSAFNAPSWSISAEAVAYLSFPWLAWVTSRCKGFAVNAGFVGMLLALFAVWPWGQWVFFWQQSPGTPVHSVDAVFRIAVEFSMGCLLFNLLTIKAANGYTQKRLSDLVGILLMVLLPVALQAGLSNLNAVIWFMALIACLARPGVWLNQLLGNKTMVYFGEISYAIYLCHMLVMMLAAPVFRRLPVDTLVQWAAALPYLMMVVWLGHQLFQRVESPARLWLRQFFKQNMTISRTTNLYYKNTENA